MTKRTELLTSLAALAMRLKMALFDLEETIRSLDTANPTPEVRQRLHQAGVEMDAIEVKVEAIERVMVNVRAATPSRSP